MAATDELTEEEAALAFQVDVLGSIGKPPDQWLEFLNLRKRCTHRLTKEVIIRAMTAEVMDVLTACQICGLRWHLSYPPGRLDDIP